MTRVSNVLPAALMSWLMLCATLALVLDGVGAKSSRGARVANHNNAVNASLTMSKWWRRGNTDNPGDPRARGCWNRPWICNRGERPPFRMRCCRNRCVDITSDVNHCGVCAIRCPYSWQCCFGLCRNINRNPWHCGKCFNRCPFGVRCVLGMCGYARPQPPCPPGGKPPQPPCPPACPPGDRPPQFSCPPICPPGSKPPELPCPPGCPPGDKPPQAACPPVCPPGDSMSKSPQASQLTPESQK